MEVIIEGGSTWQVITLEMFGFGVVESREPKGDPPSAMLLCKKESFSNSRLFPSGRRKKMAHCYPATHDQQRCYTRTIARIDGTIFTEWLSYTVWAEKLFEGDGIFRTS